MKSKWGWVAILVGSGAWAAASSIDQLGIQSEAAKVSIWNSFSGGYFSAPSSATIRQSLASSPANVVKTITLFTKSYTQSAEFKKKYQDYRESMRPTAPEKPKSMNEQRAAMKADLQKSVQEMETTMKTLPADQRQAFKGVVDQLRQQLKDIDKPDNPMFSPQAAEINAQMAKMQEKEHQEQVAKWEKDYPSSPTLMIRKWLQQFLDVCKDVDFGAKLKPNGYGKQMFENPAFESKPSLWKQCYRAGRDSNVAARTEAQQWLSELK